MDWQQPASLAVIAVTGYFFIRHEIRMRRKSRSRACGSDCGCGGAEEGNRTPGTARTNREGNGGATGPGHTAAGC